MKKLTIISLSFLVMLTAFRKNVSNTPAIPDRIDLESKLTQPATVVVESGCTATFFSTVEIKYPVNPMLDPPSADFTITFSAVQKDLAFTVTQINDAFYRDYSP